MLSPKAESVPFCVCEGVERQEQEFVTKLALLSKNGLQMEAISVICRPIGQSQKLMHLHVLSCTEEQQSRRRRGLKRMCGVSDGFLVSAGALS